MKLIYFKRYKYNKHIIDCYDTISTTKEITKYFNDNNISSKEFPKVKFIGCFSRNPLK